MVARPNGSNWDTFPSLVFEEVSQTTCRPTREILEQTQSEDEEESWKCKVEVALSVST